MNADLKRRFITCAALVVIALVFLVPTAFKEELKGRWLSKPISLGLDLSGGVYLVYEVQTAEAVKGRLQTLVNAVRSDLRKEKIAVTRAKVTPAREIEIALLSDRFKDKAKEKIQSEYRDLIFQGEKQEEGKALLTYGFTPAHAAKIEHDSVGQAIETLRTRIDQFGVAEPLIQRVGEKRIVLQMPGVSDVESVKKVVGSVARLEFRLVPVGGADEDTETSTVKDKETGAPQKVEGEVLMTGDAIDYAQVGHNQLGQTEVSLSMTSEGARTFRKITSENVGREMAIILDGVSYSAPRINETIAGGHAVITGMKSMDEATQLAIVLRSGALPAPMTVMEERTVGPSLGKESIEKGILACLIGTAFVFFFMLVYYRKAGVVACVTLLINGLLMLGALSMFGATLTLPGLAGIALTIGMAVDSNVIIFERIKDEMRSGASRDAVVSAGFDSALSAVLDANLTTLISGIILYYFGTGPIRGFAVTLSIGILTTLYCAVYVARMLFDHFPMLNARGKLSI